MKNLSVIYLGLTLLMGSNSIFAEPQVIHVVLDSYSITPDKISVKLGQPVTLNIVNEASVVPHDLIIDAPDAGIDVAIDVPAGKQSSVTFTPTKLGDYEMMCDKKLLLFKSHKDKGMHGVLEVVGK